MCQPGWEGILGQSGCMYMYACIYPLQCSWASLVAQLVKNPPAMWETWIQSLGWENPLEKGRLPTPVFWPGKFHGQRSLVGYSPWGCKGSDTTEHTQREFHYIYMKVKVAQSCLILCDSIDGSPPGSLILGIFQARVLEWSAIAFSMSSVKYIHIIMQPISRTLSILQN